SWSGLVAMLPQLGYACGMLFLVPLADLFENRRLTVVTLVCCAIMLGLAAVAPTAPWFLFAVCVAGAASCAIQILVPLAAAMAHPDHRGTAVGNVMSGVMVGILLSRPLASLVAGSFGWRWFYGLLAVMNAVLAAALYLGLPQRHPDRVSSYRALLLSLVTLWRRERVLRRYSISAGIAMAAFTAFWTAVGLRLAQSPFGLSAHGLALFAFAGVAGTVVAPLAGRAGDRGYSIAGMPVAHTVLAAGFVLAGVAGAGWLGVHPDHHPMWSVGALVCAAILIDAGTVGEQTFGRRAVNMLDPAARSRLNGLFVGTFFIGGGAGALSTGVAWAAAGWSGVCAVGLVLCALALAYDVVSRRAMLASGI
ncbi:MFS transporter, partial [Dyella sp.]|uniref:MFS transporter n=1 Tax=Dyella sp. TaxID=1869338 RepID=UPI002ED35272